MSGRLSEYSRKRDFKKTAEPAAKQTGKTAAERRSKTAVKRNKLRFVVQHHMARREHYDLRLEWKGALLSWAVPKGPSFKIQDKRLAVKVEDHPLEYRHFEGNIPKGEYGGGSVMLWDEGAFIPGEGFEEGLNTGTVKFELSGSRLKGKWALIKIKNDKEDKDNWLLIKEKDAYVSETVTVEDFTVSVRSGRTMGQIQNGDAPKIVSAKAKTFGTVKKYSLQLALLAKEPPAESGWVFETKYDGYRIAAYAENKKVKLLSRNNNDYTLKLNEIAQSLTAVAKTRDFVIDGEAVVVTDSGKTDFQALQSYIKNPSGKALVYMAFDLLFYGGEDFTQKPLLQRKAKLKELLKGAPENIVYSRHVTDNGKKCLAAACRLGLEGIIAKKDDSVYSGTRSGDWLKIKCVNRQEYVAGGYSVTSKNTRGISALLLGYYSGGDFVYAGRAGTGLSQKSCAQLLKTFKKLQTDICPFKHFEKENRAAEKTVWLVPETVVEIAFAERTAENRLRQASFKGIRLDKNARDVVAEYAHTVNSAAKKPLPKNLSGKTVKPAAKKTNSAAAVKNSDKEIAVMGINISNPQKQIFENPGLTKVEVARYYAAASERMFKYAGGRLLSLVRCPKGISEPCFYKKHPGGQIQGSVNLPVNGSDGGISEYSYIDSPEGFVSETQMGTLEFHVWGSKVSELEKPDMMVFDLDPDEGMGLNQIRRGVKDLKSILDGLFLTSYLKTSGGKGYHVVIPFKPSTGWEAFSLFAKRIAQVMEQKWPELYTSNMRKAKRRGKIFIDWVRNGRGATSVAPYSLRARQGAAVSCPIFWQELDKTAPDGIDIKKALLRLKRKDPWENFFKAGQELKL